MTDLQLTWNHGPHITLTDPDGTHLTHPITPAETAALIRRLAGYLAAWHRPDVDYRQQDPTTDPDWHPPTNTQSEDTE